MLSYEVVIISICQFSVLIKVPACLQKSLKTTKQEGKSALLKKNTSWHTILMSKLLKKVLSSPHSNDTFQVYSVTEYMVRKTNVSIVVEWKVNDQTPAPNNLEYLLSYTKKTTPGNSVVWKNMTWTTNTVSYFFCVCSLYLLWLSSSDYGSDS